MTDFLKLLTSQLDSEDPVAVYPADTGRVALPVDGLPIKDLKALLEEVLGCGGLAELLPDDLVKAAGSLPGFDGLYLIRLDLDESLDPSKGFYLGVAWAGVSWQLIPGVITVEQLNLALGMVGTSVSQLQLFGEFSIGGVDCHVFATLPDLTLMGYLAQGEHRLKPLLEYFHLDGHGFDKLALSKLAFQANVPDRWISFEIEVEDALRFGDFAIQSIEAAVKYQAGGGGYVTGSLAGAVKFGKSQLMVSAENSGPDEGWQLSGSLSTEESLKEIANDLGTSLGMSGLGEALPLSLSDITVDLQLNTHTKNLSLRFEGTLEGVVGTTALNIERTRDPAGHYDKHVDGKLLLGKDENQIELDLIFDQKPGSKTFLGVYKNPGGGGISLKSLVEGIGGNLDPAPSFKIKDLLFAYSKSKGGGKYLFALDMDAGIDLSGLGSLPLIGKLLPADQALKLAFEPVIHSKGEKAFTHGELATVTALLPEGSPHVPDKLGASGFEFFTTLRLGDFTKTLDFGAGAKSELPSSPNDLKTKNPTKGGLGHTQTPPSGTPPPDPSGALAEDPKNVHWIDLQKHFGPLHFQRLGVGYVAGKDGEESKIDVVLDAALAVGPLEIGLVGLGAEYGLSSHHFGFSLDGLAIDFRRGPLEVGAAFLRMPKPNDNDFAGKAILRTETLTLGALGAYGKHGGQPSLFIYAFVDYPLGGPAFFFVEGLAAGFGFNRRLIVPPVGEIETFPLVAEVIGTAQPAAGLTGGDATAAVEGLRDEMESLERYVPPQLGEYFLTAGVKFNTFRLVDSFALVVLSAGKHFEVDILGLSQLKVPSESPEVLAEVDMAFAARFLPLEGSLVAQAQLTPSSWVLAPECHLQGGYAFGSWFLGPHAGDFVYTMGGYHPDFQVPAHYPRVPRMGFSWRIDDHTQIKGGMYYALTPSVGMAGGHLEATWDGGGVSAWFHLDADFLISWKPFHYDARASVEIGAAVTVHCFGTHHVTISAGADLHLWGPEFAGRAHVHVKVMIVHVGFTVSFGDSSSSRPQKIKWKKFRESFLPDDDAKICTVAVTRGLVHSSKVQVETTGGTEQVDHWAVNPKELHLVTDSVIPSTAAGRTYSQNGSLEEKLSDKNTTPIERTGTVEKLGIEPVGAKTTELSSTQRLRVIKGDLSQKNGSYAFTRKENLDSDFVFEPVFKQVPTALWSPDADPHSRPDQNRRMVRALTGYALHPKHPTKPGTSSFVRDGALRYEVTPRDLRPDATPAVTTNDAGQTDLTADLAVTQGKRQKLLRDLGFDPVTAVALGDSLAGAFVLPPQTVTSSHD